MNNHYYRLAIQPKNGIFAYHSIKILNSNYMSLKNNNMYCLKTECLKCERTWFPTCELIDCDLSRPKDITFSDAEIEEINRIIKNYKMRKSSANTWHAVLLLLALSIISLVTTPFSLAVIGQTAPMLSLMSAACAVGMAIKAMKKEKKRNE